MQHSIVTAVFIYFEILLSIMHLSILFHTVQALLAPISIWATVDKGIIAGAVVLVFIGLLELFDVLLTPEETVA